MLVGVIPFKKMDQILIKMNDFQKNVDVLELRLDFLKNLHFEKIKLIRKKIYIPVIFTLRSTKQGGLYLGKEAQRKKDILKLCELHPDYFDLEFNINEKFLQKIRCHYPKIQLIGSYHHFKKTPQNLNLIYQKLKKKSFDCYKIATFAQTTLDALRLILFSKKNKKQNLTVIAMGEYGQFTRIISQIIHNQFHYACFNPNQSTAMGQLSVSELLNIYHFKKLNHKTKIYALLGDPIISSVGDILHNQTIRYLKKNAVYIKLKIAQPELNKALSFLRCLPFYGFSITMPLKEKIIKLIDKIEYPAETIQAINSIILKQKKYIGFNTDGLGLLNVLNQNILISKQKIMILGAGGAARAIVYYLRKKTFNITIVNRTVKKSKKLSREFHCHRESFDYLSKLKNKKPTLIINTLPSDVFYKKIKKIFKISNDCYLIDINYQSLKTHLLQLNWPLNIHIIPGYQMYIEQALLQIKKWFGPNKTQLENIKNLMHRYFSVNYHKI